MTPCVVYAAPSSLWYPFKYNHFHRVHRLIGNQVRMNTISQFISLLTRSFKFTSENSRCRCDHSPRTSSNNLNNYYNSHRQPDPIPCLFHFKLAKRQTFFRTYRRFSAGFPTNFQTWQTARLWWGFGYKPSTSKTSIIKALNVFVLTLQLRK